MITYKGMNKWDGTTMKEPIAGVHSGGIISYQVEHFHNPSGYMTNTAHTRSFRFGINNKINKVSGHAINVDGEHVGKSEF